MLLENIVSEPIGIKTHYDHLVYYSRIQIGIPNNLGTISPK